VQQNAVQEEITKELDALRDRLEAAAATNIGFPATSDFDYSALAPFFARYMLNNLGDPFSDGAYPMHTKPMEREVVDVVADLFGAPAGDRWGYVAAGATEGTEYALHLAATLHSDAVVYHSAAAHHSVTNVIQRLGLTCIPVRADALGEIDYDDLADQVNLRRNQSAIVVANIGTAVTEAVDDVARIAAVLDGLAVRRRWIHGDAALSGIPLVLLDPDDRPAIDFPAGLDSIVTSGHKFLGAPVPCAVVVVRNSHRLAHARAITYTGSPDTTVGNSRSGLAAMVLWYAIRTHGLDGLRARAEQSRQLAAAAHEALREIGWPAHRHKHAMTVSFPTPPASVTAKWVLATHGATSLIVCMPGVTAEQVDAFVADLRAAITPAGTPSIGTAPVGTAPAVSESVTTGRTVPADTAKSAEAMAAPRSSPVIPAQSAAATSQATPPVAGSAPITPSATALLDDRLRDQAALLDRTLQDEALQDEALQDEALPGLAVLDLVPDLSRRVDPVRTTAAVTAAAKPVPVPVPVRELTSASAGIASAGMASAGMASAGMASGEPLDLRWADDPADLPWGHELGTEQWAEETLQPLSIASARAAGATSMTEALTALSVADADDARGSDEMVSSSAAGGSLLPTPAGSSQRKKMLRRAGMPIRL
jgi:histidine decarboxylase